ncbi:MAG: PH domain-containing protein [Cryomorphaceae bacterium]|nr:PH domain-containing protein [Cryomorphaceae bacterium]
MSEHSAFENQSLESTFLPSFQGIPTERIEKKYLTVLLIQKAIQFAIVLGIWFGVYRFNPEVAIMPGTLILGGLLTIWAISTVFILVVFPTRKFLVRSHDVTYEYGRLFYTVTTIPINRIQHVSLGQSPLEQLFHLAHLNIYTAGGNQADLTLPGLKYQIAENLKDHLLFLAKNPDEIDLAVEKQIHKAESEDGLV